MNIKPLRNAAFAIGYIGLIVLGMSQFADGPVEEKAPLLIPIFMLALFVLSAAVMSYLFVYEPLKMYIDGEKKAAIRLFAQTVGAFAVITVALLVFVLSLVR